MGQECVVSGEGERDWAVRSGRAAFAKVQHVLQSPTEGMRPLCAGTSDLAPSPDADTPPPQHRCTWPALSPVRYVAVSTMTFDPRTMRQSGSFAKELRFSATLQSRVKTAPFI